MDQILRVKDKDTIPMMLVGNKCDLEQKREVSTQEGKQLASSYRLSFKEASAKSRVNVEESFYDLVRSIQSYRKADNSKTKKQRTSSCVML